MLGNRMFARIGLLVFAGILCNLLISCGSADTVPQPTLYTLEEALTLAAQTLQAESRVATASKTPTPDDNANVSSEQAVSEENHEEPGLPVTGGNDEGPSSSNSGNNGEGSSSSNSGNNGDGTVSSSSGENGDGTDSHSNDPPDPDPYPNLPEEIVGQNSTETVDLTKVWSIAPYSGESNKLIDECLYHICPEEKRELILDNQNDIGPIAPPTTVELCKTSDACEEEKEEESEEPVEPPSPPPLIILPPDALPPIFPPGWEPPVFQLP